MDNLKNRLIVFDGTDKTGKSSIAKRLVRHLNDENISSIFTFQPGDNSWGTDAVFMRSLCKDKRHNLHPLANFFAFLLDRTEVTDKVVNPSLDKGFTVISDRWHYSTVAYQLHGKGLIYEYGMPESVLSWLNDLAIQSREPDAVVYFPERLNVYRQKDVNDQFENNDHDFINRVHDAYEEMAEKYKWLKVLPEETEEKTFYKVLEMLNDKFEEE